MAPGCTGWSPTINQTNLANPSLFSNDAHKYYWQLPAFPCFPLCFPVWMPCRFKYLDRTISGCWASGWCMLYFQREHSKSEPTERKHVKSAGNAYKQPFPRHCDPELAHSRASCATLALNGLGQQFPNVSKTWRLLPSL